jgi:hypothetical protein
MTIPSNRVHDTFRRRQYGNVEAPDNTKSANSNFFIDRSRLGVHDEYDPEAPNEWGGKGKFVPTANDIRLNAIGAMGDLRAKSSYASVDGPSDNTGTGPCCIPAPYPPSGVNPMYKKRRGE